MSAHDFVYKCMDRTVKSIVEQTIGECSAIVDMRLVDDEAVLLFKPAVEHPDADLLAIVNAPVNSWRARDARAHLSLVDGDNLRRRETALKLAKAVDRGRIRIVGRVNGSLRRKSS